ncbi:hypothetical protein E5332_05605 [Enterorhabdus sp. NM05_H27]|nr:hypothetical protein E5332_05605 [Enterorhabdus sp. NM05_H27]
MADSEVLASASVEIHPYLSPAFSASLMAQMNGAGMAGAGRKAGDGFLAGMSSALGGASRVMGSVGGALTSHITVPALGAATAVAGIFAAKGWERLTAIDTAESKLKGLGYSAESIEGIMGSALASVKGTAYGLGDAAGAAVSALAAGVAEGDDLTRVLTTIGDTATIAGGDFQGVASVFNKVMSKGKMQGDEMLQLSERGVPVLQTLADYLGKTAEEVTEMTSAGEIDFATFEAAMREAFGGAALASGESMTGTIDNLWAAVGRVGAAFLDSGDDGEGFFGRLKPLLGEATEGIDGLCDIAGEAGAVLADGLVEGVDAVKELAETAQEMWDNLSPDQQGQLKALAGIAVAAGPALKIVGPLASGLGAVTGALASGTKGILSFQGSMRDMAIAANTGRSALGGMPGTIGAMASKSKLGAKAVSGLAGGLSFAAGAVPLLAAGLAAFEVVSFVSELGRAQTEAGKLEASFGQLTQGHQNMVDAFNRGMQLGTSTDALMGESGRSMEQLQGVVDESEAAIVGIIATANEEKRALRQEEIDDINGHSEEIAAAYQEKVDAHIALMEQEAKMAPELVRNMSAEEISAYVGGIKQRGDEMLTAEEEAYEGRRQLAANLHSQGVTDERAFQDELLSLQQDHQRKVAEIETATAGAAGAAGQTARFMSSETLAAFGTLTDGLGMHATAVYDSCSRVTAAEEMVQDKTRITADQFRERWAAMSEGTREGAAAIFEAAGQAAQGMGGLDENTKVAVATILSGFDGLSGEAAEAGKQALMELVNSLGDPSAVTGDIDTASASLQEIVDGIGENLDLGSVGEEQVAEYVAALEAAPVVVEPAAQDVALSATGPLYSAAGDASAAGGAFVDGFVAELRAGAAKAVAAATSFAQGASGGMRQLLKINSPSKVTRSYGRSFGEGFTVGISQWEGRAADAAASLANRSVSALASAPAPMPAAAAGGASGAGSALGPDAVGYLRFIAENLYGAMSVSLDSRVVSRSVDERQGRRAALLARKGA